MKPWKLDPIIPEDQEALDKILSTIMIGLAYIGYNLAPFFEVKMKEMLDRIGVGIGWDIHHGFTLREKGEPLYMRLDTTIPTT